jgi:hypothetical protein
VEALITLYQMVYFLNMDKWKVPFFYIINSFIKINLLFFKNPIIFSIIVIIGFSGLYLLFKKLNFKLGSSLLKWVSGILLTGVLIVMAIIVCANYDHNKTQDAVYRESKFDREMWLKAGIRYLEGCTRGKMYYDLTSHYLKKEMTREEVVALLGPASDGTSYEEKKRKDCLEYNIGQCGIRDGPYHNLVVCLNNDKVVDIFKNNGNTSRKFKWHQYEKGEIIYVD